MYYVTFLTEGNNMKMTHTGNRRIKYEKEEKKKRKI